MRAIRKTQTGPGGLIEFVRYFWDVLEPKRKFVDGWALRAMCLHLEAVSFGQINRLLMNVSPGFMKALDSDTPVLTLDGWKRHGDLQPGDFVYGPDGQPKRVIACTPEVREPSYLVRFDNGEEIVAGSGHEWAVEREEITAATKWKRSRKNVVVSTPDLQSKENVKGSYRRPDRIRMASAFWAPAKRYLIDSYLLGAWLGDGSTRSGCLYVAEQDIEHFAPLGEIAHTRKAKGPYKQDFHRVRIDDLQTRLRTLGLLGNKHVPEDYLLGNYEQRLALLQGLMDTDGHANGPAVFTNKNVKLAEAVAFLASSIGAKPFVSSRMTTLNGKVYGPHYQVTFTPPAGVEVFRLKRKQANVTQSDKARTFSRYIESVDPIGHRVVKCIQVEGGIYLAGRGLIPTHNSMLVDVFWPAWEWSACERPDLRYVAFSYAAHLTERDNGKFLDLLRSAKFREVWGRGFALTKTGTEKVGNNKTGWKFASSVGGVGTGERGDRAIVDDPHNVKQAESDQVRMSTANWFNESLQSRLNDLSESAIIVIMQRVHQEDVSGIITREYRNYVHLCIPMEYDPFFHCTTEIDGEEFWTDPRTEKGELAWPERYPDAELAPFKRRKYLWSGQYQQTPVPRGGGILKAEYWRTWDEDEAIRQGVKPGNYPEFDYIVASLDTAYTEETENDPSAMTVWGLFTRYVPAEEDGDRMLPVPCAMLVSAFEDHLELHALVQRVTKVCKKWKPEKLIIEAKAAGHSVAQEIRRLSPEASWSIELVDPGRMDKVARAHSVEPMMEMGLVYAPIREWAQNVIDQCADFPRGTHDDLVDTVTQALAHLRNVGLLRGEDEIEVERDEARRHRPKPKPLYHV